MIAPIFLWAQSMIVTYKILDRINFPVFILPSSNWDLTDGLLYLDGELVDDKNMPGKTLGQRRLQTPHKGLIPLRKSLDSLVGILKQPNYQNARKRNTGNQKKLLQNCKRKTNANL